MGSDWFLHQRIAHRGLHDENIPENSMEAFKHAEEMGYAIELDVQLMRDGNIAVFHDDFVDRMTSGHGDIREMTAHDLKEIHLNGNAENIPTLDKVFETIKAPIYIDVKSHGKAGKFEQRLLSLIRFYNPNVIVASENPNTLIFFKEHASDIKRGLISHSFARSGYSVLKQRKLRNLSYHKQVSPHFISYDLNALPFWRVWFLRKIRKIPVIAWTIKDSADQEKAMKYADNYIFENILPR